MNRSSMSAARRARKKAQPSPRRSAPGPGALVELSIGQLAREAGLSTATIHYYVTMGVLPPARKLNRTRAAYSTTHLRLLRLVRRMQAVGYTLEQVKRTFRIFGTDETGLTKLEGVGALQPLPPPKTDLDQRPIELFDPIDRAAFLERSGCSAALLDELLARGLLRPLRPERFDARDLWFVRMILVLQRDGVKLEELGVLRDLLRAAERVRPIVLRRIERHGPALRARSLRFTDLVEPFGAAFFYWVSRLVSERNSDWIERLTNDADRAAAPAVAARRGAPGRPSRTPKPRPTRSKRTGGDVGAVSRRRP